MSILKRIFGRQPERSPADALAHHRETFEAFRTPALHFRKTSSESFSKIGGRPLVNDSFEWPEFSSVPLSFVAQLDLANLRSRFDPWPLPGSGLLLFFYHSEQATWGFDPKDRGSWRVIHIDDDPQNCSLRAAPSSPQAPTEYPEKRVEPYLINTLPSWEDARIEQLGLSDSEADAYIDECSAIYLEQPAHQLFGYASPQQSNDMDLECQLVSNGLYCGDSSGYADPRAEALKSGAADWRLLLQVDSDDDAGMMWGDLGMLYFWIRNEDLRDQNFDNTWMILQCG